MKKSIILWPLLLIVVVTMGVYAGYPNTSKLVIALLFHTLPDSSHLSRIRNDLLEQDSFVDMLIKHEKVTVQRFKQRGEKLYVKKYIHKTPTSMFDIKSFHDYWEVWVRTDIIDGQPMTSFLVRLGLIKDTNAENFFRNQCESGVGKFAMKSIVSIYNRMFDLGIFKPIRLNITETDETSSISRNRITISEWNDRVWKTHSQGHGKAFQSSHNSISKS